MSFRRVNAYTQWGKLKRCVVGNADYACFQPPQPSTKPVINQDPHLSSLIPWPQGPKLQKVTDEAEEQLGNLASLLQANGVETYRPKKVDWNHPITTPGWSVPNQYCSTCPRDVMITIGNIMIEAPMSRRDRFLEYQAYQPLTNQFWREDANSLWKSAPKNSMNDSMYHLHWSDMTEDERANSRQNFEFCLKNDEIIFDAADFTRTGKHVFGQISMTTNKTAIEWLHRELEPHGFIVHPLHIQQETTPSHIDCTLVVLRPGLVMENPDRPLIEKDKKLWLDNGWKFIQGPQPVNATLPQFSQSSKWLNMNVLVIDEDKVIVEAQEEKMAHVLEDNGFTVLPIDFRKVFEFGGSLHCSTWDIEREDEPVDMFPNFKIEESEWHNEINLARNKSQKRGYVALPDGKLNYGAKAKISKTHLTIEGHPVMESWETPYMHALADKVAAKGGHLLEVGFGMAISAGQIQSHPAVTKHSIIEINKDVFDTMMEFKKTHPSVNGLLGPWQERVHDVEENSLDGVFYDPYPSTKADQHTHQFDFLKDVRSKLKVGGHLTYCNLTSLGVLKSNPDYNKAGLTRKQNWGKLMEETQIPHLLAAGWHRDEIDFEVYVLPQSTIDERDSFGCEYYSHSDCLVPYLIRKR